MVVVSYTVLMTALLRIVELK